MERYFYRLGKKITVQEIEGIVAVKIQLDEMKVPLSDASHLGDIATREREGEPLIEIADEESQALAETGWIFIRPSRTTLTGLRGNEIPEHVEHINTVYQQEDGHVLIGTNALTVQYDPDLSSDAIKTSLDEMNLNIVRELRFTPNQYEVTIPDGSDLLDMANSLQEKEEIIYAEPTFIEYIGQRYTPSDPNYNQQWQHNNTGGTDCISGADISAEDAWNFTLGTSVRLAVIDNGFDVNHLDLAAGVVTETGFFDNTGNFQQTQINFPDSNHGTVCAGMAAARHNNNRGGCGSAPEVDLLLVATRGDQVGTQATLARAIAYAANPTMEVVTANPANGADIISCSLGPNGANWALTTVLQNAINYSTNRGRKGLGTPIFWASSNGNNVDISLDEVVSHPGVIAVGRSRCDDTEDNSARGEELDFLAPGVNVYSTESGGGYGFHTGTSFAAPLSAGVGAMILSINQGLTWMDVRQIMRDTSDKIGGVAYDSKGHNQDYGYGRINAFRCVRHALQSITQFGEMNTDFNNDNLSEIHVSSPWGIGTLAFKNNTLNSLSMAQNGSRFDGWLLNTDDNIIKLTGDFDGDSKSELLVISPWGIGVLSVSGDSYSALMLKPNGTRFNGWLLNTADNWFGPVGDFDGDGKDEILVHSPWGVCILKLSGNTFTVPMMKQNGTRFNGWLLNTADNWFGPVGDFDGDGKDEILVHSPWGVGILKLSGNTFTVPMMKQNGTRFNGWLLNTADNWFGPVGDFDGDGKDEFIVGSPWGIGILELSGSTLNNLVIARNGSRFGGWLLNTYDNRFLAAVDFTDNGNDEIFVSSPWGIGIIYLKRGCKFGTIISSIFKKWGIMLPFMKSWKLASLYMKQNGTRINEWLLNTQDNHFNQFSDMTGNGKADILVSSPWGIGIFSLSNHSLNTSMMAPNGTRFDGWLLNTADNCFY